MTRVFTGPLADSSLRPNCSCRAVKIEGGTPSGGGDCISSRSGVHRKSISYLPDKPVLSTTTTPLLLVPAVAAPCRLGPNQGCTCRPYSFPGGKAGRANLLGGSRQRPTQATRHPRRPVGQPCEVPAEY